MPKFAVVIEILQIAVDHISGLDGFTGFEGLFQHPTGFEIAYLDSIERLPFTRLDEFVFNNGTRVTVEEQFQTTPELIRAIRRHSILNTTQSNKAANDTLFVSALGIGTLATGSGASHY